MSNACLSELDVVIPFPPFVVKDRVEDAIVLPAVSVIIPEKLYIVFGSRFVTVVVIIPPVLVISLGVIDSVGRSTVIELEDVEFVLVTTLVVAPVKNVWSAEAPCMFEDVLIAMILKW